MHFLWDFIGKTCGRDAFCPWQCCCELPLFGFITGAIWAMQYEAVSAPPSQHCCLVSSVVPCHHRKSQCQQCSTTAVSTTRSSVSTTDSTTRVSMIRNSVSTTSAVSAPPLLSPSGAVSAITMSAALSQAFRRSLFSFETFTAVEHVEVSHKNRYI